MGFYIRKGINLGPLRLNLSRSGLGMSVGVKGARVGLGPRGSYVHLGRGGLYYRQSLGHPFSPTVTRSAETRHEQIVDSQPVLQDIASAEACAMSDASSASILEELNRVQQKTQWFPIVAVLGVLFVVVAGSLAPAWVVLLGIFGLGALAIFARNEDVTHGTAVLNYFLDLKTEHSFSALKAAFDELRSCDAAWHVDARGKTEDWKHQAGVSTILKRSLVHPCLARPPRVVSNLEVPTLSDGRQKIYFFPDRLLIYERRGVGAVSYRDLEVAAIQSRFVEDGRPPRDAQVVDHTWQYVNKKGGPDRRFANNPRREVALYSSLLLASGSGLAQVFQFSRSTAAQQFATILQELKNSTGGTQSVESGRVKHDENAPKVRPVV
jgi:hypothetical protein